ncbi:alpha-amylase family glycosyl hydrolase [Aquibacillus sp. 3ASR75-11]|uniref:Alpha-amylase family glycosyl hydrolase n=1 Tax=Terrihalobacillus insolitus TaxID=2950438 RepID=A0A9X3WU22_9BACI|nr:alpha-amylase family glycosyl hydrolase [Terrihalobacillus insolitus]MDC3425580.1 alpha-amylase family glycosyl hydrolase [Terrihalobacillus insolitus]
MNKVLIYTLILPLFFINAVQISAEDAQKGAWEEEVVYYVLVDRFVNGTSSNDQVVDIDDPKAFRGGDIQRIIDNLDYIKGYGFTTINLSPIMKNAKKGYHGYWITDFRKMEPSFGTMDDMKELVKEAHDRNMKVIIDFPIQFTATTHPWTKDQNKKEWYKPNNYQFPNQPWLNEVSLLDLKNKDVQQEILKTALFWLENTNIDGYRLKMLEDVPPTFLSSLSSNLSKEKSDFILVGDMNGDVSDDTINTYLDQGTDSFVDPSFVEASTDVFSTFGESPKQLYQRFLNKEATYKDVTSRVIFLDSQETTRFTRKVILNKQNPITRWKLGLTYLYTTPGIPVVYQGSEIPMDNGKDVPDHQTSRVGGGDEDLKTYIEQLASIRIKFPALTKGDLTFVDDNGAMTLIKRTYEDQTVYVAINNDVSTKTIAIDEVPDGMQLTGLIQDNIVRKQKDGSYKIALDRETADIFIVEEDTGINWLVVSFIGVVFGGFVLFIIALERKAKKNNN